MSMRQHPTASNWHETQSSGSRVPCGAPIELLYVTLSQAARLSHRELRLYRQLLNTRNLTCSVPNKESQRSRIRGPDGKAKQELLEHTTLRVQPVGSEP